MREKIITEPNTTDWIGDTIIIGGGVAGICASIAAARLGCKVALVQEKMYLFITMDKQN